MSLVDEAIENALLTVKFAFINYKYKYGLRVEKYLKKIDYRSYKKVNRFKNKSQKRLVKKYKKIKLENIFTYEKRF